MIAKVDDRRVGLIVRALRRRRGWRQKDLAGAGKCSQSLISLVERGHLDRLSTKALRTILAALDATAVIEVRWRAGELDRLLDEHHARLVGRIASILQAHGWLVATEVTYARYRERGSYDVLAFHPDTRVVLVVEVKTDLPSVEATLRKLDEKARLAASVAQERFGVLPRTVARLVVMPDDRTLRRRVERHVEVLRVALPQRGVSVRKWIATPTGALAGLWFLTDTNRSGAIQKPGGRQRVRKPRPVTGSDPVAA